MLPLKPMTFAALAVTALAIAGCKPIPPGGVGTGPGARIDRLAAECDIGILSSCDELDRIEASGRLPARDGLDGLRADCNRGVRRACVLLTNVRDGRMTARQALREYRSGQTQAASDGLDGLRDDCNRGVRRACVLLTDVRDGRRTARQALREYRRGGAAQQASDGLDGLRADCNRRVRRACVLLTNVRDGRMTARQALREYRNGGGQTSGTFGRPPVGAGSTGTTGSIAVPTGRAPQGIDRVILEERCAAGDPTACTLLRDDQSR